MPDKTNLKASLKSLRELTTEQYNVLYKVTRLLNAPEMHESLIEKALDLVISVINAERGIFVRYDLNQDDFKIIAQTEEQEALFLLTEDRSTMSTYCEQLRTDNKINFKIVELSQGFDQSLINGNGQTEMHYPTKE